MMRRLLALAVVTTSLVLVGGGVASAHPLGNFTVNHYDGLVIRTDVVQDTAVVDAAEIPTAQSRSSVDANGDGTVSAPERTAYAVKTCAALAPALSVRVNGRPASFGVDVATFEYRAGAAGLPTSRLTCMLHAAVDLSRANVVAFRDDWAGDRIGWHEITARGVGTHLRNSPVPAVSVTDELRHYPNDLLSAPLDVRSVRLDVQPGVGLSTVASGIAKIPGAGPVARLVEHLNRFFSDLAGSRHLTFGAAVLALLVSLLLGASHAALPGHGKTVMAVYLTGKHGGVRDAVVVGTTVTLTHTAGVVLLGIGLTVSSSLAGDQITGDLGVVSGILVAAIGVSLLVARLRPRAHDHHEHGHAHPHAHVHDDHAHAHARGDERRGRLGLVGMGVAGGLVPSPSALVVLLGALALHRVAFGLALVVGYGVGMAATLTAAGLVLVRVSDRLGRRAVTRRVARRLTTATPFVTAGLVVVVGLGLAARSLATI